MPVRCKTFDAYIKELIYYPRRAPKWLADKRLTLQEKKILQGHLLIRNNKNAQVITELKSIPVSDLDFVRDHWNLLLGICYNNTGSFKDAEKHLMLAIDCFEEKQLHYHLFTALFNLINLLSNTCRIEEMAPVLKRMEEICPDIKLAQIRLLRCQFIHACDTNKDSIARDLIQKINATKADMSESDLAQHQICEFMFFVKHEELDHAQDTLVEMKKFRNYSSSENYQFMRTLLSHLLDNSTIYAYERDFPTLPVLFWQLKVVESLQGLDRREAKKYWDKLCVLMPNIYKNEFHYRGEKCLFSLCLSKHLTEKKPTFQIIKGDGSQHQQAYKILQEAQAPIRKEHLYELIYNESPEDKEDLVKLSKLISKVRAIHGVEIISRKGTYFIEKEIQKMALKK